MIGRSLPDGRTGSLLAVALLALVTMLLWLAVVQPIVGFYQERQQEIVTDEAVEAHMAALAASLPRLKAILGVASARRAPVASHLAGTTDALAAADLQTAIGQIAVASGVEISSIETPTAENTVWGRRIGVSIRATANYQGLAKFIARLETSQPKMVVDDLEIHSTDGSDATIDTDLNIGLSVFGFRAPGGGS